MFLPLQGVGHTDQKVLVLAATNTPYALDQVSKWSIKKIPIYGCFLFLFIIPFPRAHDLFNGFICHRQYGGGLISESTFLYLIKKRDNICLKYYNLQRIYYSIYAWQRSYILVFML